METSSPETPTSLSRTFATEVGADREPPFWPRGLIRIGGAVYVLALAAGCATSVRPPADRVSIPAPAEWSVAQAEDSGSAGVMENWIHALGGAPLEQLVNEALEHNRDLAVAAARVRQSAAQARLAGAGRWPELGAAFSASRAKTVIANPLPPEATGPGGAELPELLESQATRFDLSAELSWEADVWGRLSDSARAAEAGHLAARADFTGARLALAGEVTRRWVEYVEATRQLEFAEQSAESFQTHERVLSRRFDAGLGSALDVRLARTSSRAAAATVVARRQQQDALARSLEILLGRYPDRSIVVEDWPAFSSPPSAGIPAEVVQRRPDLWAAEARYAAAVFERGAARKLRYPQLILSASAGTASTRLGDVLDSDFGVWSLVGGLTAPIFSAGRIGDRIDIAAAEEEAALEEFASTLLNAYREVETSLAAERLLTEREARVADLAEETARAEQQAWEQYERGLVAIPTVLEAQRRAFESASQLIGAQAERRLNRVTLHLALGGGVPESVAIDEPPSTATVQP